MILVLFIILLILAIYAVIITYLYFKEKEENSREIKEGKIDMKVKEIRRRLNEVQETSYPHKIDIEEEKER